MRKYGFESIGLKFDGKHGTSKGEENVQKACPRGGGEPSNRAAVAFVRGTYIRIRERARREERQVCAPEGGKMARTPLAAFFNIPGEVVSTPFLHQHFTPSPLNPPTRGEELETKGRKATTVIKHDTGGALSLKSMAS